MQKIVLQLKIDIDIVEKWRPSLEMWPRGEHSWRPAGGSRVTAGPGNTVFCVQDSPAAGQHAAAEHGAVRAHERSMDKVHIISTKYIYSLKHQLF